MNQTDTMSPTEYAELVRDARALVTAMERAVRRTAAVFVVAIALTIAAAALDLRPVATVTSVVAVIAFVAAVILLTTRIALGAPPAEAAHTVPAGAVEATADGSGSPATGSGPATPTNGVIPPK